MSRNRTSEVQRLSSVALRYQHPLATLGRSAGYSNGLQQPSPHAAETAKDVQPRSLTWRDVKLARLEAVLFLSREPVGSRKLARPANLADGTEARTLVGRLNQFYDQRQCAFRVEEVAGGFQLMTRPRFGSWLRRLCRSPVETRLSGPAMETLSVVAYRQPVLRAEIESIRGVQCGEMLRQLMERELVRMVGRADELGRPFLYGTTRRFLEIFGLRDLDELPRAEALRRYPGIADRSEGVPSADTMDERALARPDNQNPSDDDEVSDVITSAHADPSVQEREQKQIAASVVGQQDEEYVNDDDDDDDDDDDLDDDEEELDHEWEEVEDDEEEDEDWEEEDWDDDEEWDEEDEEKPA